MGQYIGYAVLALLGAGLYIWMGWFSYQYFQQYFNWPKWVAITLSFGGFATGLWVVWDNFLHTSMGGQNTRSWKNDPEKGVIIIPWSEMGRVEVVEPAPRAIDRTSSSDDVMDVIVLGGFVALEALAIPVGMLVLAWLYMSYSFSLLVTGFIAVNLICYGIFGRLMADPRGGWSMWWRRERYVHGNSRAEVIVLMIIMAGLWAVFGIFLSYYAVTGRHELRERLDREDARRLEAANGNA